MAKYQCVFDSPKNYLQSDDYYLQGCNPALLRFILAYLTEKEQELTEVYISLPVYNNSFLDHALQKLAKRGVKVTVITKPIDSYRNTSPVWITDLADHQPAFDTAKTPYQIARHFFVEAYQKPKENFHLKVFPHFSIKDHKGNPFAKGQQPYSLELNSFLFLFNQGGAVAFSSSDLSCGEPVKEGHLLLNENDWTLLKNTRRFFEELSNQSFELHHFNFSFQYSQHEFPILPMDQKLPVFYLAPFYENSPSLAEEELVRRIRNAKERIWIQSPIINCYEYTVDGHFHSTLEDEVIEHFGFLRPVLERASIGADVKFLTSSFPVKEKGILSIKEEDAFAEFRRIAQATPNNTLATTANLGSSFLILDNQLILSSSPFRPDVFVYLDQVRIQGFTEAEEEGYTGIFSATSFFWLIDDQEIVEAYRRHFTYLWEESRKRK